MQDITPLTSHIEVLPQASGVSSIEQAIAHYGLLTDYIGKVLKDGVDYATLPRTKKPTLLKPGAEKLIQLFSLRAEFILLEAIYDWNGEQHGLKEPLFFYSYKCVLYHPKVGGQSVGEGTGSCNSLESKYRGENWRFDHVHVIQQMAIKRAMVSAVLIACGVSQYFTQSLEDWQQTINGTVDDPREKDIAIATVGELIKQLGWSIEQGQAYLKQSFGVTGRKQLSLKQLHQLIEQISQMVTPKA